MSYNESLKVNVANVDEPFVQVGATLSAEADGDSFGYSVDVAQSSSSVPGGTIVAVGAPRNSNDYGSARVFSFVDGSWSQLGNDIDSPNSSFSGHDVSLNSDGTILAVGGGNYGVGQGWVRVYQLSGGTSWNLLGDSIVGQANNIRSGGDVELKQRWHGPSSGSDFKMGQALQIKVKLQFITTVQAHGMQGVPMREEDALEQVMGLTAITRFL